MLAAEKARRLAKDGFRTLLVYFNQPLARELASQLADAPAPGCLDVSTFHELCRKLGHAYGLLPMPEPDPKPSDWFDALLSADAVPEQPSDTILCESIRRFKGLESPVVVLVELDPADARLQQLLYVGATRAREHLVVITPETL